MEHFCGNCIYMSERKNYRKENDGKQKRKTEAGLAVNKDAFYKEVV